jgi:CubicO group peptidase (beta-lactamase class C family)
MQQAIQEIFDSWNESGEFSGVISVSNPSGVIYQKACGYRNRAERLPNDPDTSFAIASGTKFFTALAVCQLIDSGRLRLDDRVWDILPYDLKMINKNVTVFHLLTHTSGIGDYIDEEVSSDYYDILSLYDNRPVHKWESLEFYLPMIHEQPQKFAPGARTGYSNAGFILLGLVVESVAKQPYQQYVTENIIRPLGLTRTGFYRMNQLPGNTALGYIFDEASKDYITNVLFMPIIGGSDGGLFTSAGDMITLWDAVLTDKLFSASMREQFLTPHGGFGLGVYLRSEDGRTEYHTEGGDFGVDFFSAYYPETKIIASALGNTEMNTGPLRRQLFDLLAKAN